MSADEQALRYSVKDIQASYSVEKAKEERYTEWAVYYLYRPLSFQMTPVFLHLGLSPSNVTFISLVLAICLPFIALWFPLPYLFVGIIGILVSVLDCVDGNIARVTGNVSKVGGYFDFLTDILYRSLMYFSIGIIVSQMLELPPFFTAIATECLLIAALLTAVARMCRMYGESEIPPDKVEQAIKTEEPQTANWIDKFLFPAFSGMDWMLPFLVIMGGMFGILHWVLLWLLFYSILDFLHTQYSLFSKLQ